MANRDRRRTADAALVALDGEIAVRWAELAALQRARDTIARSDRCDIDSPLCAGLLHTALCRACGHVVRRCLAHGAARSATADLRAHEREAHGAGWANAAATEDTGGVFGGGPAVPLGCLSTPPTPDGGGGPAPAESAEPLETAEPRPKGERG